VDLTKTQLRKVFRTIAKNNKNQRVQIIFYGRQGVIDEVWEIDICELICSRGRFTVMAEEIFSKNNMRGRKFSVLLTDAYGFNPPLVNDEEFIVKKVVLV
jgi:spore coat polysaccharide biosynthesis predicted glycosyltransferase SpsG